MAQWCCGWFLTRLYFSVSTTKCRKLRLNKVKMHRYITGLVLLAALSNTAGAQQYDFNIADTTNPHNRYKCVKQTSYQSHEQWGCILRAARTYKHTSHFIDADGNQLWCAYYDKDWKLMCTNLYTYIDGYKTEEVCLAPDSSIIFRNVYVYDSAGVLSRMISYKGGGMLLSYETDLTKKIGYRLEKICYDERGKETGTEWYDTAGNVLNRKPYPVGIARTEPKKTYDGLGRLATEEVYNRDGTLRGTTVHVCNGEGQEQVVYYLRDSDKHKFVTTLNDYDEQGRLMVSERTNISGTSTTKTEYVYHPNGRKAEVSVYIWKNGYYLQRHEGYTADGKLSEQQSFDQGKFSSDIMNTYDAQGRLVRTQSLDSDGSVEHTTWVKYLYPDAKGNWCKKVTWDDDLNTVSTTTREIEYY